MHNDILFKIATYCESTKTLDSKDSMALKLNQTLQSCEVRQSKIKIICKTLNEKLRNRLSLDVLIERNIYKKEDVSLRFKDIHEKLKNVIGELPKVQLNFTIQRISPKLANTAKQIDFHLKKRVLRRLIKSEPD